MLDHKLDSIKLEYKARKSDHYVAALEKITGMKKNDFKKMIVDDILEREKQSEINKEVGKDHKDYKEVFFSPREKEAKVIEEKVMDAFSSATESFIKDNGYRLDYEEDVVDGKYITRFMLKKLVRTIEFTDEFSYNIESGELKDDIVSKEGKLKSPKKQIEKTKEEFIDKENEFNLAQSKR